jgi:hypothetical protein
LLALPQQALEHRRFPTHNQIRHDFSVSDKPHFGDFPLY